MLSIEKRFEIWQELLSSTEGTCYNDVMQKLAENGSDVDYAYKDIVRKDKEKIAKLLKINGNKLLENKLGRNVYFSVEKKGFNLVEYIHSEKVAQPYMAIMDMLSKSKGLLPEQFLNSLSDKYKCLSENVNVTKSISFDADYDYMVEIDVFPDLYKSLNKNTIWLSFHPVNKPEESRQGIFSPEYIKQYRSNWYVFGMFAEDGKELVFQKIPLCNIDDYNDTDPQKNPFIKSHIEDYNEYFDDIIGVENPENNEVETIKFRISNRMFQRLKNNPLHSSQSPCKELDIKGFHGMKMEVKYNIELMRIIMNYGSDMEILAPPHIRKRVIKELQKTLKLYNQ